jgi:hypothetical protein
MVWARLNDTFPVHPAVRSLSDAAFRLYISAVCWASLHQAGGHIPSDQLHFIADHPLARAYAGELVRAGLWETADDGWRIREHLGDQPDAEPVTRPSLVLLADPAP